MSVLNLDVFAEALEKVRKHLITPQPRIRQVVISEGNPDPTHPHHWRNRSGIQKFLAAMKPESDQLGIFGDHPPLIITPTDLHGYFYILFENGTGWQVSEDK